jgi:hypothetical protein
MERIQALIDKLCQQKAQSHSPADLLPTVQLLYAELLQFQQKGRVLGTSKVAVTMPVNLNLSFENITHLHQPNGNSAKETFVDHSNASQYNGNHINNTKTIAIEEPKSVSPYSIPKPARIEEPAPPVKEAVRPQPATPAPAAAQTNFFAAFDFADEAPTLVQHQAARELNEKIAAQKESLNDRLKEEKKELAQNLKDIPIKDLKKGIGINERFTFVSELFRGDDAMYERSIKTINSFGILSEAEYWINRELKFKLGWSDQKDEVQQFYQLVRRRFS